MSILFVSYDIDGQALKRSPFIEEVKQYNHFRVGDSCFYLKTRLNISTVFARFTAIIGDADAFQLHDMSASFSHYCPQALTAWLQTDRRDERYAIQSAGDNPYKPLALPETYRQSSRESPWAR